MSILHHRQGARSQSSIKQVWHQLHVHRGGQGTRRVSTVQEGLFVLQFWVNVHPFHHCTLQLELPFWPVTEKEHFDLLLNATHYYFWVEQYCCNVFEVMLLLLLFILSMMMMMIFDPNWTLFVIINHTRVPMTIESRLCVCVFRNVHILVLASAWPLTWFTWMNDNWDGCRGGCGSSEGQWHCVWIIKMATSSCGTIETGQF